MKLAFSTLGVPGLAVDQVVRLAADHGYHGVELRACAGEEPVHTGLTGAERAAVAGRFEGAGVEVVSVAGYARVARGGPDEPVLADLREQVGLAADLGAGFVRVFPGGGEGAGPEADAVAARRLAAVAPYAEERGVRLALETHDSHPGGTDVARVMGLVGHRAVGAVWDLMSTWRAGEEPFVTYPVLSPHLGYVQVKDIASREATTPLPLGEGVLPLADCVELLSRDGWDGWLSWEYEKRWYPQAAELPELLAAGRRVLGRLLDESA
ncbi:sugar phosphate isomerase/epimerase family protein [Streptomyces sp. SL13]|uniref:Sugar phosphate isomerase/epimerase family protein n=1 Tax=Streptantibioticus silvisoli TaxID=2705255 RepID=A0AA90H656_9ACTN|nr:sugar phosphate isomerase/epimerase family protein [Streptantibioticus silvisoli]MDI5967704.1 sugar phosphate isomerase/epimerase family protein [Streptantibioticus silvisoli]MDI5971147.1 sugar phosphate isomerase/epimerase family protein [Streptantibioticus silvisoli]